MLNSELQETLLLRLETRQECSLKTTLFTIVLDILSNKQKKITKQNRMVKKEEIKLSLLAGCVICIKSGIT